MNESEEEYNEEQVLETKVVRHSILSNHSKHSKTAGSTSFRKQSSLSSLNSERRRLSSSASNKRNISFSKYSFLKGVDPELYLNPFYPQWSFGVKLDIRLKNLTTKDRSLVYYASSHMGVLYDYVSKEMQLLQGHKNLISSIGSDDSGKWLITADAGVDSSIMVWDSTECIPIHTIFNSHAEVGSAVVAISGNAKYLISIGKEIDPVMNFWCWTYGNENPDDSYIYENVQDTPVKICFNPDIPEHIMVAFQKQVFFFSLINNKIIRHKVCRVKKLRGIITDCTYMENCHECVATTSTGCFLLFGHSVSYMAPEELDLHNNKIFAKTVKVGTARINCIVSVDDMLATGDSMGHIKFYDKKLKILYWCQNFELPSITSIAFELQPRKYKIQDAWDFDDEDENFGEYLNEGYEHYEDKSEEYEHLYANLVPSDATLNRLPFVVRDFFIATSDGRIARIDYMRNICDFLFKMAGSPVTAIDTHDEENYLCIAYADGNICLYDYVSRISIAFQMLPEELEKATIPKNPITAIKYSPESLHLACGRDDGSLWFLDPIYLTTKHSESFRLSEGGIIKIAFSIDSRYLCYYNSNNTLVIMKFLTETETWISLGKLKAHYKTVRDILFSPYLPNRLFSIGEDRLIVEYNVENSGGGVIETVKIERFEQTALPTGFIYYPFSENSTEKYFFATDNQYKYKKVNDKTFMTHSVTLGPAYGCYYDNPISKLQILPDHENQYMIFANDNHIGIQILPADGNPFKFVGTIGHPKELLQFRTCRSGKYIFTIGRDDNCVLMWRINVLAPETMEKIGGPDLYPFYCLIEGGLTGWLFKEMQDLFYYMQILHEGENNVLPRIVSDMIPVSELPDLMRACGFYPTEYEIENMVIEVKYQDFDETKALKDSISFYDFVKMYVNYRPPHGVSLDFLQESFNVLCMAAEEPANDTITDAEFVTLICEKGETFSPSNAHTCLATLMHYEEDVNAEDGRPEDFSFLPSDFDFDVFLEDILGIDLERETVEESDKPIFDTTEVEQFC